MDSYSGRNIIITGAASGIGRATAIAMAKRGANVVVADRDEPGANGTVAEISAAHGHAQAIVIDVAEEDAFERLLVGATASFGGVDLMMNNVGVLTRGYPEHLPISEWQRILNINLLSVVRSHATFVPYFQNRGAGHIVNTASFAGLFTYSYDRLPYAASKAAIIQISEGMRLYLEPQNIGVTVLCPGPTKTNISDSVRSFGPETVTRGPGPQFKQMSSEAVAEKLVEAVLRNDFMVYSDDQVVETLQRRASDWNGYIESQTEAVASIALRL